MTEEAPPQEQTPAEIKTKAEIILSRGHMLNAVAHFVEQLRTDDMAIKALRPDIEGNRDSATYTSYGEKRRMDAERFDEISQDCNNKLSASIAALKEAAFNAATVVRMDHRIDEADISAISSIIYKVDDVEQALAQIIKNSNHDLTNATNAREYLDHLNEFKDLLRENQFVDDVKNARTDIPKALSKVKGITNRKEFNAQRRDRVVELLDESRQHVVEQVTPVGEAREARREQAHAKRLERERSQQEGEQLIPR